MPPHPHRPPLPGHLDQRTISILGLDPNPLTIELGPLRTPCRFQFNHQALTLQDDFFTVGRMARLRPKGCSHRQQLQPCKRHDQRGALCPEKCCNTQRYHAQRHIKPSELSRRDGTVTLEKPLHGLLAVTALRGQGGETKRWCWLQHVATPKKLQPIRRIGRMRLGNIPKIQFGL